MRQPLRNVLQTATDRNMAGGSALARNLIRTSFHEKRKILSRCTQKSLGPLSHNVSSHANNGRFKVTLAPLPSIAVRAWSTKCSPLNREMRPPGIEETPPDSQQSAPSTQVLGSGGHSKGDPTVHRVPDEHLPSHKEGQRWDISKRFGRLMEELLANLATASQKVNNYTGTDFSGIESLRKEIKEQEALVKSRHNQVVEAKEAYDAAYAQQAASQKEVVSLLERKNSWTAPDLERYMALIRSEHLDDQAVQAAKERRSSAERALEEARTRLEQRERAQYHEEQIWSDTIRRNSTWVTIGLMGVNITLLLASLMIIEPWRRNRLVREIRNAFEENKAPASLVPSATPLLVDDNAESALGKQNTLESAAMKSNSASLLEQNAFDTGHVTNAAVVQRSPTMTAEMKEAVGIAKGVQDLAEEQAYPHDFPGPSLLHRLSRFWLACRSQLQDSLSKDTVEVRRIDITAIAVGGAAVGGTLISIAVSLLRRS